MVVPIIESIPSTIVSTSNRLNSRFDFERKQDGVYQKIFGKYVLDEDAQIRVTDRTTAEEYLVDYALKG